MHLPAQVVVGWQLPSRLGRGASQFGDQPLEGLLAGRDVDPPRTRSGVVDGELPEAVVQVVEVELVAGCGQDVGHPCEATRRRGSADEGLVHNSIGRRVPAAVTQVGTVFAQVEGDGVAVGDGPNLPADSGEFAFGVVDIATDHGGRV